MMLMLTDSDIDGQLELSTAGAIAATETGKSGMSNPPSMLLNK